MGTRRQFLAGAAAGGVALPLLAHADWASAAAAPYTGNTLVVLFLRGGSDGLSVLAPVGDAAYHDARPSVAIADTAALALGGSAARGDFGWHPAAPRLAGLYDAGRVAAVPAAGSPDHSRSHFDCQAGEEAGRPEARTSVSGGWLGRYLSATAGDDDPLRAFAAGYGVPASLRGYNAISAPSLDQLGLIPWGPDPAWAKAAITAGYTTDRAGAELSRWAATAVGALDEVAPLTSAGTQPPAGWPNNQLGRGLFTIARLLEAGLPTQVATVDLDDWDHHAEMGPATDPTGRTSTKVAQLDSGGVDHGWGGPMLVVGGGVSPGVKGPWPGVAPADLVGGDLAVAVDHRTVLSELLTRRLGASDLGPVFPGFDTSAPTWVGVTG